MYILSINVHIFDVLWFRFVFLLNLHNENSLKLTKTLIICERLWIRIVQMLHEM